MLVIFKGMLLSFGQFQGVEQLSVQVDGMKFERAPGNDDLQKVGDRKRFGGVPGLLVVEPIVLGSGTAGQNIDNARFLIQSICRERMAPFIDDGVGVEDEIYAVPLHYWRQGSNFLDLIIPGNVRRVVEIDDLPRLSGLFGFGKIISQEFVLCRSWFQCLSWNGISVSVLDKSSRVQCGEVRVSIVEAVVVSRFRKRCESILPGGILFVVSLTKVEWRRGE